jgi:hypothetical protein
MRNRRVMLFLLLVLFTGMLAFGRSFVEAQPAVPPVEPADTEVLARGPLHEAFAEPTATESAPPPVVPKEPPAPIEELVPQMKPSNGDFSWIPGYWSWDADAKSFLWTSGVWRIAPPGRSWIPGSWHKVDGGWQWSPGYWALGDNEETEYLPDPPASEEKGPAYAATEALASYVPGSQVYSGGVYQWQTGFWASYRTGWVWVAASYRKTPAGSIYVPGYWDMPLLSRGLIYAPVNFSITRKTIIYRPKYIIEPDFLIGALFVKKGTRTFYFGNWFEPVHAGSYVSWVQYLQGHKNKRFLDAEFKYYRNTTIALGMSNWERYLLQLYDRRSRGLIARPPISLDKQIRALSKIAVGEENSPVSGDIKLTQVKNVRAMRSSSTAHRFVKWRISRTCSTRAWPRRGR